MTELNKGGRPAYLKPEERTRPRSVRLSDIDWEKLKRLGGEWLKRQIRRAKEPEQ